jgi:uncharacterized protein
MKLWIKREKQTGGEPTPFWKEKPLEAMTDPEWESLCCGCGICCLNRLHNRSTGKVYYTTISCRYLDLHRCRCTVYAKPFYTIPECEKMTPKIIRKLRWLPKTCGYRSVAEGRGLAWWHPLVSGDPDTVHQAGISVRNKVISETAIKPNELDHYIIRKPNTAP